MMIKFRSKRFSRSSSSKSSSSNIEGGSNNKRSSSSSSSSCCAEMSSEIKWELRPGGMLVQKRDSGEKLGDPITVRVCTTGTQCHDIPIEATSTFGELKMILSMVTKLEPMEQRLLFRGKEREDTDHLHMVGVGDKDKILLLQDPAIKERKKLLARLPSAQPATTTATYRTITV